MGNLEYRVWHVEDKRMYDLLGFMVGYNNGRKKTLIIDKESEEGKEYVPANECLLMCSSDLMDNNNVLVYEGDVIETIDGRTNVVCYDEYIDTHDDYPKTHLGWTVGEKTLIDAIVDNKGKVIGNIYEDDFSK